MHPWAIFFEGVDNPAGKVRKYRDWAVRIRTLSSELWQDLSKTLDAYEIFRLKHVVYFQDLPDSHPHLLAVHEIFDKLEMLKKTLQSLVERCNGLAQDLLA
ncbi:hypothetical protein AYL99_10017 [Fonsecaea erecta]|uniref:Uncharacterized protein n=1 Tax=Fonsecaea erecta TaxID=1367422 RepID=A0A178Z9W2_9EURO|nr:hypothetical protein AYL99_10017 [Fonsecaea erecta]OAP55865.1 hypothetical protein AYL99_10017 [Fonsecaea erecta]